MEPWLERHILHRLHAHAAKVPPPIALITAPGAAAESWLTSGHVPLQCYTAGWSANFSRELTVKHGSVCTGTRTCLAIQEEASLLAHRAGSGKRAAVAQVAQRERVCTAHLLLNEGTWKEFLHQHWLDVSCWCWRRACWKWCRHARWRQ